MAASRTMPASMCSGSIRNALRRRGRNHFCMRWMESIPGGFGGRGIEGMVRAATYARETKVPLFGICLGMQVAIIEYARNVAA